MKTIPIIIATLTTGITIGYFVNSSYHPAESASSSSTSNSEIHDTESVNRESSTINRLIVDIDKINQRLQQEIAARQSLEEKLDRLSHQIASLDQQTQFDQNSASTTIESEEVVKDTNSAEQWFNEQALVDSGMSSSQAGELKSFFEQQELDRMYLRDQSIRENWDRQKYREEIQTLADKADTFLNQLDEQAYDAYLYASQQPNRVRVMSVLDSSQAGSAGIQAGDHIISYDNKRVYSGFELRSATTGGDINQTIAVEIERDGEIMELYLNRGPLGIRMNSVSIAPSS